MARPWCGDPAAQVAVKELFGLQGGSSDAKEYGALMNEVTLLGSLSHPNIMRFLAVSSAPSPPQCCSAAAAFLVGIGQGPAEPPLAPGLLLPVTCVHT